MKKSSCKGNYRHRHGNKTLSVGYREGLGEGASVAWPRFCFAACTWKADCTFFLSASSFYGLLSNEAEHFTLFSSNILVLKFSMNRSTKIEF